LRGSSAPAGQRGRQRRRRQHGGFLKAGAQTRALLCTGSPFARARGPSRMPLGLSAALPRAGAPHLSEVLSRGALLKADAHPHHHVGRRQVVLQHLPNVLGSDAVSLLIIIQHHLGAWSGGGARHYKLRPAQMREARLFEGFRPTMASLQQKEVGTPPAQAPTLKRISACPHLAHGTGCRHFMALMMGRDSGSTAWHSGQTMSLEKGGRRCKRALLRLACTPQEAGCRRVAGCTPQPQPAAAVLQRQLWPPRRVQAALEFRKGHAPSTPYRQRGRARGGPAPAPDIAVHLDGDAPGVGLLLVCVHPHHLSEPVDVQRVVAAQQPQSPKPRERVVARRGAAGLRLRIYLGEEGLVRCGVEWRGVCGVFGVMQCGVTRCKVWCGALGEGPVGEHC
jgi:hypothetical protein